MTYNIRLTIERQNIHLINRRRQNNQVLNRINTFRLKELQMTRIASKKTDTLRQNVHNKQMFLQGAR